MIIYRLEGRGGGGGEDFGGITLFLGEQKGRSVVTENPKREDHCLTLEGFRGGTTQICLHGK